MAANFWPGYAVKGMPFRKVVPRIGYPRHSPKRSAEMILFISSSIA